MKQKKIGTFAMGHENVDLYALPDERGGFCHLRPDYASLGRIHVGLGGAKWHECAEILLHESLEFLMLRMSFAHGTLGEMADDVGQRVFMFTHTQFSEMCARQATFVATALPELEKAWKKANKRGKHKNE